MDFGVMVFPTDTTPTPVELGRATEDLGFESLWFPEHSHIPISRETPWGGVKDAAPLPDWYWKSLDAFVALSAVAAVTSKLKLGTGITLVAQRDPIWLAKEVASLDVISEGRAIFGIGYGWNKEEMASHGVGYHERRELVREKVMMMKSLWTDEVSEYQGDHVTLEPSWAFPKPVQTPHPPIIMGGAAAPKTIGDMVEFCDGWMPLATRHDLQGKIEEVRRAVADAGRDPASFNITAYSAKADPALIETLQGLNVDRVVFNLPQKSIEDVQGRLKKVSELIDRFQ